MASSPEFSRPDDGGIDWGVLEQGFDPSRIESQVFVHKHGKDADPQLRLLYEERHFVVHYPGGSRGPDPLLKFGSYLTARQTRRNYRYTWPEKE